MTCDYCTNEIADDSAYYLTAKQIADLKNLVSRDNKIAYGVLRVDGYFQLGTAFNLNEVRANCTPEDQIFQAYYADHEGNVRLKEIVPHFTANGRFRD